MADYKTEMPPGQPQERQAQFAAYAPLRLTQLCCDILLRLKTRYAPAAATRFTLHSVSGFRMPDGCLQVERLAGFCHHRNSLKNYWAEQIGALLDPDSGNEISDLTRWLALRPPAAALAPALHGATAVRPRASAAAAETRQRSSVMRAVEKAIACAAMRGLDDVADRLGGIRDALEDGKLDGGNFGDADLQDGGLPGRN